MEMWRELITAIQIVGARVSDLTRSVSDVGSDITDMARTLKRGEEMRKELLEEVRQMVWVQDQTRGMVHVVAKRLEGLEGVERVPEQNTEIGEMETESRPRW